MIGIGGRERGATLLHLRETFPDSRFDRLLEKRRLEEGDVGGYYFFEGF